MYCFEVNEGVSGDAAVVEGGVWGKWPAGIEGPLDFRGGDYRRRRETEYERRQTEHYGDTRSEFLSNKFIAMCHSHIRLNGRLSSLTLLSLYAFSFTLKLSSPSHVCPLFARPYPLALCPALCYHFSDIFQCMYPTFPPAFPSLCQYTLPYPVFSPFLCLHALNLPYLLPHIGH